MFDYSILEVVRLCGLETVGSPSRKGEQKVKCPFVSGKTFLSYISFWNRHILSFHYRI